jgi:hypothetical protein
VFGPDYVRLWWAGPNISAGRSLLFARIALAAVAVSWLIAVIFEGSAHGQPNIVVALLFALLVFAAAVLAIVGIVLGAIGVRASGRLGALAAAIWGLCTSGLVVLMTVPVAIVFLQAALH